MTNALPLPNSIDKERAVLGSLMLDPAAIVIVGGVLQPAHFYDDGNRDIYAAMMALNGRGEVIDLFSVVQELEAHNQLDRLPGADMYVAQLTGAVATSLNVKAHAKAVADLAKRRQMIGAATRIAQLAMAQDAPIDEVSAQAQATLNAALSEDANDRLTWMQTLAGFLDELETFVYSKDEPDIFRFGISDMDAVLGDALMPGNLGIVAAKKKAGKSTLMRQHMMRSALSGHAVAIFSFEEREYNIAKSVLSRDALQEINRTKLRAMRLAGKEDEVANILAKINESAKRVSALKIYPVLAAGWRAEQVCLQMEYYARAHGVKVFEIDYLQLITSTGRESRRLELADISKQLATATKQITRKGHSVFTLLSSQVNDDGRTREAEDPENDCDFKVLIEPVDVGGNIPRDGRYPVTLGVELNRHGATGKVNATFDKPRSNFGANQRPEL